MLVLGDDKTYSLPESSSDIWDRFAMMGKMNFLPQSNSIRANVDWFRILSQNALTNTEYHSHSGIEMHFLLQGSHIFHFQNHPKLLLQANQGLLIPANLQHQLLNANSNGYFLRFVLNFSIQAKEDNPEGRFVSDTLLSSGPWRFTLSDKIVHLLDSCITEAVDMHCGYVSVIENNIIQLLFLLAREKADWPNAEYPVKLRKSASSQIAEEAKNYIEENGFCGLGVQDVAKHVHMSTKQLQRIYKQEYGITVYAQIEECIFQKAKRHLRETSLSVSDIAHQLGFSGVQSFCRFFRSKEGQSPKEYKLGSLSKR